jgi:hypothetical protein
MNNEDDEDDDDAEDVGTKPFEDTLNYDSDGKNDDGKMISLEEIPKPKKAVPKLKKPSVK